MQLLSVGESQYPGHISLRMQVAMALLLLIFHRLARLTLHWQQQKMCNRVWEPGELKNVSSACI